MQSTDVMAMTTMATACVLSFLEVDEGEEAEEEAAAEEAGVVDPWDPKGEGMAPPLDDQSTGFLCQVREVLSFSTFVQFHQIIRFITCYR